MKKIITLISLIIIPACTIFAQKEGNIWYFGDQAGLDFNSGTPVALTNGALITSDNSSTISDTGGNVLFYTNGVTVWNKNNAVMYNGTGLLGNISGGQSTLIVPEPDSSNIYYVFTVDAQAGPNGLHYSIVDMSQQAGLGAVTVKNILLFTPSTEKIDATYDVSTNSYWVLTHTWNSNDFNAYKISSAGIDTVPVVSAVGSVNTGGNPSGYNAQGQMTFSPDGLNIASAIYSAGIIELFNFNLSTGVVSNPITITGYTDAWGTAFSPDDKKLYFTRWFTDSVYQFDLTIDSLSAIEASATIIGHANGTGEGGYEAGYLQIGPDGKIYVARWGENYLGVINDPDSLGSACNFVNNGVFLGTGVCQAGLSRTVVRKTEIDQGVNELDYAAKINVYPNPNKGAFTIGVQNIDNTCQIQIYNILGEGIYQGTLNAGNNQITLNAVSSGVYLYKIFSVQNRLLKSGKILVQ